MKKSTKTLIVTIMFAVTYSILKYFTSFEIVVIAALSQIIANQVINEYES